MYSQEEYREYCPIIISKEYDQTKKVSKEDMIKILESGRLSPSSFRLEPWKFLVIEDSYLKEKLKEVSWGIRKQASTSSYVVVILSKSSEELKYNSKYIKYILREILEVDEEKINVYIDRYKTFLEDDFEILDTERALFDWGSKQSYIPLTSMMIAAGRMGIGSCPIEGFNRSKLESMLIEEGLLDVGQYRVSVMISFGYELDNGKKVYNRKRRPSQDIIQWV